MLDSYIKGKSKSNADSAAEEAAQRLWKYRQPLAFGVHQVAPEGRLLACEDASMQLYRQNDGLSEEGLMRHVSCVICFVDVGFSFPRIPHFPPPVFAVAIAVAVVFAIFPAN